MAQGKPHSILVKTESIALVNSTHLSSHCIYTTQPMSDFGINFYFCVKTYALIFSIEIGSQRDFAAKEKLTKPFLPPLSIVMNGEGKGSLSEP